MNFWRKKLSNKSRFRRDFTQKDFAGAGWGETLFQQGEGTFAVKRTSGDEIGNTLKG